jgi:nitroreductase
MSSASTTNPIPDAASNLLQQMQNRQHIAPKRLAKPGPNPHELQMILQAAVTAPDHGRIRPWRFVEIPSGQRERLGEAFAQALLDRDPQASSEDLQDARDKALRAPTLWFAMVSTAPVEPDIAMADRWVALGCAIQNTQLMAQALGFGCGITSGQAVNAQPLRELFGLSTQEVGVCFLSFGTITVAKPQRARPTPPEVFSTL